MSTPTKKTGNGSWNNIIDHVAEYTMENKTETSRQSKRINTVAAFLMILILLYFVFADIHGMPLIVVEVSSVSKKQSSSTTKNTVLPEAPVVLVVVKLSAEMGNQLHRIANGQCVKHLVEERLGLPTKFFIMPNSLNKVEPTRQTFPNVRRHIADEKTTADLASAHQLQSAWINELLANNRLNLTNVRVPTILSERFCSREECYVDVLNLLNQILHMGARPTALVDDTNISLPLVYVDRFAGLGCLDSMFDKFKDFFKVDEDAICNQVPDPDESVFHFRNHRTELSRKSVLEHAMEEVDPKMAADVLFADSKPADKVAIVSRFQNYTDDFIRAFREKGMKARYIEGQTSPQDFCFLYKAEKELITSTRSTFGLWAAYFGRSKRARIYSLSTSTTRARGLDVGKNHFSNKELQDRLVYENYNTSWR